MLPDYSRVFYCQKTNSVFSDCRKTVGGNTGEMEQRQETSGVRNTTGKAKRTVHNGGYDGRTNMSHVRIGFGGVQRTTQGSRAYV